MRRSRPVGTNTGLDMLLPFAAHHAMAINQPCIALYDRAIIGETPALKYIRIKTGYFEDGKLKAGAPSDVSWHDPDHLLPSIFTQPSPYQMLF